MSQNKMLTPEQLKELSKDEIMALWNTLPTASIEELDGEYLFHFAHHGDETIKEFIKTATNPDIPSGVLTYKAFKPLFPLSDNKGLGYLAFRQKDGSFVHSYWYDTEIAPSGHDGKACLRMLFGILSEENPEASLTLPVIDEVRKYDDGVYIAVGAIVQEDGSFAVPAPYLLTGPAQPFRGEIRSIAKKKKK